MKKIYKPLQQAVRESRDAVKQAFQTGLDLPTLLKQHSDATDAILLSAWQQLDLSKFPHVTLIAVGGYGRAELLPHSDIDFLLLSAKDLSSDLKANSEEFISLLWDIGLDVSHSVRTINQCVDAAKDDITIISNLLEMRYLAGCHDLFHDLKDRIAPQHIWSSKAFFQAKCQEQEKRYAKYDETAYNLEPNIKYGPGGLRDIQTIVWVAKRHFATDHLPDLITHGFLTQEEFDTLISVQHFLWKISCALHLLTDRNESRLSFDHQHTLAKTFSYQDKPHELAIEQFMQDYYRNIKTLRSLNDMLLQLFREVILQEGQDDIQQLNERFQIHNHYIETVDPTVFKKEPSALLEIFVLLAQHDNIQGVRATTIRLIRQHRHLINQAFIHDPKNCQFFITLLRQSSNIADQLQRMNRYDVLAAYIPPFSNIVGQMQHDLFHVYTVDQHTIFLVRNLRRFAHSEYRGQFPLCANIIENITRPEVLYIAALFHDIAKGCGGDHSALGAEEARAFCQRHQLTDTDTELIVWLIQHHLLMSSTAQRQDIYDPSTVEQFAAQVQHQHYLDHLYLLTVADICATNPSLWNSWKDSLLKELYQSTRIFLGKHDKNLDKKAIIEEKKETALELLDEQLTTTAQTTALWQQFTDSYFLRETPANIAWHTQAILEHSADSKPLILVKQHQSQGATEIVIYAPTQANVFAITTMVLANNHLDILEAKIVAMKNHYCLASYIVLDENQHAITQTERLDYIVRNLRKYHTEHAKLPRLVAQRIPRRLRHFSQPTQVHFSHDPKQQYTLLEVISPDRPGLLARIAKALMETNLHLHSAKIITLGDKVDDLFCITQENGRLLTDQTQQDALRKRICKYLD